MCSGYKTSAGFGRLIPSWLSLCWGMVPMFIAAALPLPAMAEDTSVPRCSNTGAIGELSSVESRVEVFSIQGTRVYSSELTRPPVLPIASQSASGPRPAADASIGGSANNVVVSTLALSGERRLCPGDRIVTGENSRAGIALLGLNSVIRLGENTTFELGTHAASTHSRSVEFSPLPASVSGNPVDYCISTMKRAWLFLRQGTLRLFTDEPRYLNVNTPYLNASIEGTEFSVSVATTGTEVSVTSGSVSVCNAYGAQTLKSLQRAVAKPGFAPQRVDPDDAVQWALFYPTALALDNTNPDTVKAVNLLQRGQVEQALVLLDDESNADHLAIRAMIAITQNRIDAAEGLSKRALIESPLAASGWLAASWLDQARFNLESSLTNASRAQTLSPEDSQIQARMAELALILGDSDRALSLARQSLLANPDSARSHAVSGLVHLHLLDFDAAIESFTSAVFRDESAPLPRLGLALAHWRLGNLAPARRHLEMAVNLNPSQSVYRSYLGKVYLGLGRHDQALEQFAIAEQLDEQDPTPHLYRATLLQERDEPVRALYDLQQADNKGNFRAVYRSRAQLDEDLAVSLANSGRIYQELGFDQVALARATQALHATAGSYVAHRMLADTWRKLPRHLEASASAQLQSQIRQPMNNNPTQIQLADSKLSAFRDTGPLAISLNEYSRLFSQDGVTSYLSAQLGSQSTRAIEAQSNLLAGKWSASLLGYSTVTEGIRHNSDEQERLLNAFVQTQPTNNLGLQFETLDSQFSTGDDFFGFDREATATLTSYSYHNRRMRLGLNARLSPHSRLLIHTEGQKSSERAHPDPITVRQHRIDGTYADVQHQWNSLNWLALTGMSYANEAIEDSTTSINDNRREVIDRSDHRAYFYAYPTFNSSALNAQFKLALGVDHVSSITNGINRHAFTPKAGVIVNWANTVLRGAAFRAVARSLANLRSLEPAHIAGFAQKREDFRYTRSDNFGLGWDRKFQPTQKDYTSTTHIGGEYLTRYYRAPGDVSTSTENVGSAYIYFANPRLTAGLTFSQEQYANDADERTKHFFVNATTRKVSLDFNLLTGHAGKIGINPLFIQQHGTFYDPTLPDTDPGSLYQGDSTFWLLNLSWELPLRFSRTHSTSSSLTIHVDNALDRRFNFQDTDPFRPGVSYERAVSIRVQVRDF